MFSCEILLFFNCYTKQSVILQLLFEILESYYIRLSLCYVVGKPPSPLGYRAEVFSH